VIKIDNSNSASSRPAAPPSDYVAAGRRENFVVIVLIMVLLGLPLAVWLDITNIASDNLQRQASDLNSMMSSIRSFYVTDVVSRVLNNPDKPTRIAHNYKEIPGAIPLPASLALELGNVITNKQSNISYRFVSDYPFRNRPAHSLDPFETRSLAALRTNHAQPFIVEKTSDWMVDQVRVISPVVMSSTCVTCHNNHPDSMKKDWKSGDVRGFQEISIRQPIGTNLWSFKFSLIYFLLVASAGLTFILAQRRQNVTIRDINVELAQANAALSTANTSLALSVDTLRQLGDIGRDLTTKLDADSLIHSLYQHVGGLVDAAAMTIYRVNASATALDLVFGREYGEVIPPRSIALDSPTANTARVARERQEVILDYEADAHYFDPIPGTHAMRTAMFSPLIVDDQVLGVMSIQSDRQHAYGERERLIFRTLSAYGAIALANAEALTALHRAQARLVQQEKLASLGGLVDSIAHEINTPLGTTLVAISGAASVWQALKDAIDGGRISKSFLDASTAEGLEYSSLALRAATRAAELITVFKSIVVRADSDQPVAVDLTVYLPEMAEFVRTSILKNRYPLTLELAADDALMVHIVQESLTEALTRVFINVLDHAADHALAKGESITLRMIAHAGDDGDVVIAVSDNGHGIAPQDLPKVFDPFFTTKSGARGHHIGLGLHVANHVTQRLKGKIAIASTLGQGTTVTIRLKRSMTPEQPFKTSTDIERTQSDQPDQLSTSDSRQGQLA
jgi:signal transduction histidine kinase